MFDYLVWLLKEFFFKKGDIIWVFKWFNNDWWDGIVNGIDGFVFVIYICILIDDEVDIIDGEGNIFGELLLFLKVLFSGVDRFKDFNVFLRIFKREGFFRGRDGVFLFILDLMSFLGLSF